MMPLVISRRATLMALANANSSALPWLLMTMLQAEQGRAVVAAGVDGVLWVRRRTGRERSAAEFAEEVAAKFLLQRGLDVFGNAFHRFQRHVTDEAIADDDVELFLRRCRYLRRSHCS